MEELAIRISSRGFMKSKPGETTCADALRRNDELLRWAVADGVSTKSLFSGRFAELLVEDFCKSEADLQRRYSDQGGYSEWVRKIKEQWRAWIEPNLNPIQRKDWEEKGAVSAATFAGVWLQERGGEMVMNWYLVGDSQIAVIGPTMEHEVFSQSTGTDGTNVIQVGAGLNREITRFKPQRQKRPVSPGTTIILATDAIGKWITEQLRNPTELLNRLQAVQQQADFDNLVADLYTVNELKPDDCTLVIVQLSGDMPAPSPSLSYDPGRLDQRLFEHLERIVLTHARKVAISSTGEELEVEFADLDGDYQAILDERRCFAHIQALRRDHLLTLEAYLEQGIRYNQFKRMRITTSGDYSVEERQPSIAVQHRLDQINEQSPAAGRVVPPPLPLQAENQSRTHRRRGFWGWLLGSSE